MDPLSIAVLGTTALKTGLSFFGTRDAARQRRRETDEAVRRLKIQQAQVTGTTVARGAASGFETGSPGDGTSLQTYLAQMSDEFKRESDWMRKAGYAQAKSMDNAAFTNLLGDLGGGVFQFGAANNWFKTPSLG